MERTQREKVALLVAAEPPDQSLRDVLRLTGYVLHFERTIEDARAALQALRPQLAILSDPAADAQSAALVDELQRLRAEVIVTSVDDITLQLAARLGLITRPRTSVTH